jgi:hypothetical protein
MWNEPLLQRARYWASYNQENVSYTKIPAGWPNVTTG